MLKKNEGTALTKKQKIVLFSIILGTFMTSLDATIVTVALPTMAKDFATEGSTADISWVLLAYTLTLCCFVLLWGKLGTNIGYRNVFLTGITIFATTSLIIGLAGFVNGVSLGDIIVLRAIQGLGAGMVIAMGLAMVSTYMPLSIRGATIGYITLAASAGTAFGPALGGILVYFHWSYIFFINVPIGLICILMSLRSMNNVKIKEKKEKLDITGAGLLFIMMFALIYYLNVGQNIGWMSHEGLLLIFITLITGGLVAWWEQRAKDPLVSLRLIAIKDVIGSNVSTLLLFGAMSGSYLLLPYYLQYAQGYTTVELGFIMIANSIGILVAGPTVGKLADATGVNSRYLSIGCLIGAAGFFMMTFFTEDTSLLFILLALFVMGMGVGTALVASTNLCFGYCKEGEDGQLSGLVNTFRQAGSSMGVAILNAVFLNALIVPVGGILASGGNLNWMIDAFRPAFFVAVVLALVAFTISMGVKDKKYRDAQA
ncbi:MAG: MFS transporter [Candidatus Methanomethylophilaceae archaeon]|jgi:EmrB/QacA subfamily drug resistance transporter